MSSQPGSSMDVDGVDATNNNVMETEEKENESKNLSLTLLKEEDSKNKFMQVLYDFELGNVLCDAVIKLEDGGVFSVHRAVLSTCSTYFRTLFTTTLHSEQITEFHVPGIDSEIMSNILEYAYLRRVKLSQENVYKLRIAADYLMISGISELCRQYVRENLTNSNCISAMQVAIKWLCKGMEEDALNYVIQHFPQVSVENSDMVTLPLDKLKAIIGAPNLNVKSEDIVWELVVKWIDHDPDDRKVHVADLMRLIRLGLLDTEYFMERVRKHPYVSNNETCRPIVIETLKFLYDMEMISMKDSEILTPELARPRVPFEIMFAIAGWSPGGVCNYIESYDTRADRWIEVKELSTDAFRAYHGLAVIGFDIYIIGGFNGVEYFNSCVKFNAATKVWSEVAHMNCKRCYLGVAVLNDVIYAMGGSNGMYRQKSAEKYDYKRNQWTAIAKMNFRRSDAGATTLKNKIYIVGGFNGSFYLNTAEVYDPETNQWTLIRNMRSLRSGSACIAYHDHIYAIGGFNGSSRLFTSEKYSPVTRTWTSVPNMYIARSNFAIAVIDDMIFVMGGYNGITTICHVECYCGKSNEWYEATDMNFDRSGVSACVIFGLPNVLDYTHKHRDRLMEEKRQTLLTLRRQLP